MAVISHWVPSIGAPGARSGRHWRDFLVIIAAIIAAVLTIVDPGTALAQSSVDDDEIYVPELRTSGRTLIGAGAGIGFFDGVCGGCRGRGGLALELYGGWQFHPRVALILDVWSTVHFLPADGNNPGITGYTAVTASVQTWITPIVFTRLGAGGGAAYLVSKRDDVFDPGPSLSLTVGGELGHRKRTGVDLSIRIAGGPINRREIIDSVFYSLAAMISYHRN